MKHIKRKEKRRSEIPRFESERIKICFAYGEERKMDKKTNPREILLGKELFE